MPTSLRPARIGAFAAGRRPPAPRGRPSRPRVGDSGGTPPRLLAATSPSRLRVCRGCGDGFFSPRQFCDWHCWQVPRESGLARQNDSAWMHSFYFSCPFLQLRFLSPLASRLSPLLEESRDTRNWRSGSAGGGARTIASRTARVARRRAPGGRRRPPPSAAGGAPVEGRRPRAVARARRPPRRSTHLFAMTSHGKWEWRGVRADPFIFGVCKSTGLNQSRICQHKYQSSRIFSCRYNTVSYIREPFLPLNRRLTTEPETLPKYQRFI